MKRLIAVCWMVAGFANAAEVTIEGHTFTIPEGFEIQKVAGPPLVDRPIVADFDARGRLFVADSAGVNDRPSVQVQTKPHRIVRLEDTDGDGVFDKSVVFADKMMFPEGILCHDGAVFCGAPPIIWKLEDTDDDGVADKRTEWFDVGTLTGCANDLHGPYLGPAGWIYWTKGAFAKLDLTLGDGSKLTDSAAHIFRARPDGSGLESFLAGGMDNPVEVAFNESGELFFTTTFIVHPRGEERDGIVHGVYGGVYGKKHGVIDGLSPTGELLGAMTHLGAAAPSGLCRYRSDAFGDEFQNNLFSSLFNLRKVMRHEVAPTGSSYTTRDFDFVVSDNVDFHPTDVLEDADGSLLILDTGGWYKLCCPTSVIAKPEVLGAIYRVRKVGSAVENARGQGIELMTVAHLDDPRPAVRDRAVVALASRGEDAVPELLEVLEKGGDRAALHAVWALARMRSGETRRGLGHHSPTVQAATAYAVGLERDANAREGLVALLSVESEPVRRAAMTALGRIGNATEAILGGKSVPRHVAITALIEANESKALVAHLEKGGDGRSWAASALEALDPKLLKLEHARDASGFDSEIAPKHPEWAGEIAKHFVSKLADPGAGNDFGDYLHWPEVGKIAEGVLSDPGSPAAAREFVMACIVRAGSARPGSLSDPVVRGIAEALKENPSYALPAVLKLEAKQFSAEMRAPILKWMHEGDRLKLGRGSENWSRLLSVMELMATTGDKVEPEFFEVLVTILRNTSDAGSSVEAARSLSRAKLSEAQLASLCGEIPGAGSYTLGLLLGAFESGGGETLGATLAEALAKSKAVAGLSEAQLKKVAAAFPEGVREAILAAKPAPPGIEDRAKRLDETMAALPDGDVRRGHQVFKSNKAACATCHRLAYVGGELGPPLDRIARIRTRRDLLESIVFPSASYARGFEPMIVTLASGEALVGTLSHPDRENLAVTEVSGRKRTVPKQQIKDTQLAPASLMPPGFDQVLTKEELADLLAFLESLK